MMLIPPILALFGIDDAFYILLALSAVTAGVSYVGQQKAADAQEDAGLQQKQVADQNAQQQEAQTAETVRRERINARRRLARIRTGIVGMSGLSNEGSIEDAFVETAGREELKIQDIARAGSLDAQSLQQQGDMAYWESRTQAAASRIGATGTLLSNVASMGDMGIRYYGRRPSSTNQTPTAIT